MTMIDAALAALETVCSNVSFVKNEDDPLPDSYVVLSVLDDTPEVYAGDLDEQQRLQVRAAWYTRDLPQPCSFLGSSFSRVICSIQYIVAPKKCTAGALALRRYITKLKRLAPVSVAGRRHKLCLLLIIGRL